MPFCCAPKKGKKEALVTEDGKPVPVEESKPEAVQVELESPEQVTTQIDYGDVVYGEAWRVSNLEEVPSVEAALSVFVDQAVEKSKAKLLKFNQFYVSKGEEKDEETSEVKSVLFVISATFGNLDGNGPTFHEMSNTDEMKSMRQKYSVSRDDFTTRVVRTFGVNDKEMRNIRYPQIVGGATCINIQWVLPAEKVEWFDELWREHEIWMRETHNVSDDTRSPACNHYFISKGSELDAAGNETGNMVYAMSETYTAPEEIKKHMDAGFGRMHDLMETNKESSKYVDICTQVWKTL